MAKKDDILPAVAVVGAVGVVGAVVAYKQGWFGKGGIVEVITVKDPAGNVISEAIVKLAGLQGVTGDAGQVKFAGIQPGTYTLSATAATYQANSKQITASAAGGSDSITLTPSVTLGGQLSMTLTPLVVIPPAALAFILKGGTPTGSWVITAVKPDGTRLQLSSGVFDGDGLASGQIQFVNTQGGYGGTISATPQGAWALFMSDLSTGKSTEPVTITVGNVSYPRPVVSALLPDGTSSSSASYLTGQGVKVSVKVSSSTAPTSVQGFFDGVGGTPLPWNPATAGYDFILDYGPATVAMVGHHAFYAQVTFSNGVSETSNVITIDVAQQGLISVKVLNSYDNSPVAGARVVLGGQVAYTDANGVAGFTGLSVGSSTLSVSATGYNFLTETVGITTSTTLIQATIVPSIPGR